MSADKAAKKKKKSLARKIGNIVGIVLCVIMLPILLMNITLLAKSYLTEEVPSFFGIMPFIVRSGSMEPEIMTGDLIAVKKAAADSVSVGDVISYYDPGLSGNKITTHRVVALDSENRLFTTQGLNEGAAEEKIPYDCLVGKYTGVRFAGLGDMVLFLSTTAGLVVCVIIPLMLLVGFDLFRREMYEKKHSKSNEELLSELEALKAEKAAAEAKLASKQAESEKPSEDIP